MTTGAGLVPTACPACRSPWSTACDARFTCPSCHFVVARRGGIWRALTPEAEAAAAPFLDGYRTVRRAEGWGNTDGAYYRALPFRDVSGRHRDIWRIRATSFQVLERRIVRPLRARMGRPLRVLDVGAGNGWLAQRSARSGDQVAAIDLDDDPRDGLGAHRHYDNQHGGDQHGGDQHGGDQHGGDQHGSPASFAPVQATFDRLPYAEGTIDLVIFNGALHYSKDYPTTLREALRVLAPHGRLAVLDSPFYRRSTSGDAMVRERDTAFRDTYGPAFAATAHEGFLTRSRLAMLGQALDLDWQFWRPWYGWRWALRPWAQRLRGRREPARFYVVEGQRGVHS